MGKKKKESIQINEAPQETSARVEKRIKKDPELVKKDYVLKEGVTIGKTTYKKGDKVALTEKGRKYFKSIHKI